MEYLRKQYALDAKLRIKHNYLFEQFCDSDEIFDGIAKVVSSSAFTLGIEVTQFEEVFAKSIGVEHAIGVGSGTDAITLSLLALGIEAGDEVIVPSFTFYASVGAIISAGATPVFADIRRDSNIDPHGIAQLITPRTKAILVVHWAGRPCAMDAIQVCAEQHGIDVIEDACHAYRAAYKGRYAGTMGATGCFSLHPLKNINVWGDGGVVTTNSREIATKIRLLGNHGLIDRDNVAVFGRNSRLDTIQAVVANHFMKKVSHTLARRSENASVLDHLLGGKAEIELHTRHSDLRESFQLYSFLCDDRDSLKKHLQENGIDAKVHYPIPMHLQKPARKWGYNEGDFPVSEHVARHTLSIPIHEFVEIEQITEIANSIVKFYAERQKR
jgi:dTDP-4-amino-4,6-dideoxygalactose transaminase